MALNGTIGDFGLPDILQLIGLQRKTAVLQLDNSREKVVVKFLNGDVVSAESASENSEDRLGQVLVRTGKISQAQLDQALAIQEKTLQRLGHILVRNGYINEEQLVEALRVQSMQVLFRLFRWREGQYKVQMVEDLDYDRQHATPISAETLLMEGARMVDEWPIIERRIKSEKLVFARTEAAEGLDLEVTSLVDADIDFDFVFGDEAGKASKADDGAIKLSPEERQVLSLVDGSRTVGEINDRSSLGEFDTYRLLAELATRDLIREVRVVSEGEVTSRRTRLSDVAGAALAGLLMAALAAGALATLDGNRIAPWRLAGRVATTEQLRVHASQARLERVEEAIQVYYLNEAVYPTDLEALAARGYLAVPDLTDPWGRPYGFERSAGGYRVFGHDAAGEPSAALSRSHRFSAAQQMMLDMRQP